MKEAKARKIFADIFNEGYRDEEKLQAIETMTREIARLKDELEKAQGQLRGREQEISLLPEALRTERAARETMKMNAKLWEQIKGEAMERVHE